MTAPKLPAGFGRLWTAQTVSSLGDGVTHAALPLLALTLTRDPMALAVITAAGTLPWLLFGVLGGALVDRWDRRRTMWVTDTMRAALLVVPAGAAALDVLSVPLLAAVASFLGRRLGTGTALSCTAALEGLAILGLAAAPNAYVAGLALAVCGAGMGATMVLAPSLRQAIVPAHMMGRVTSTSRMLAMCAAPFGAFLGGWLATAYDLRTRSTPPAASCSR